MKKRLSVIAACAALVVMMLAVGPLPGARASSSSTPCTSKLQALTCKIGHTAQCEVLFALRYPRHPAVDYHPAFFTSLLTYCYSHS